MHTKTAAVQRYAVPSCALLIIACAKLQSGQQKILDAQVAVTGGIVQGQSFAGRPIMTRAS